MMNFQPWTRYTYIPKALPQRSHSAQYSLSLSTPPLFLLLTFPASLHRLFQSLVNSPLLSSHRFRISSSVPVRKNPTAGSRQFQPLSLITSYTSLCLARLVVIPSCDEIGKNRACFGFSTRGPCEGCDTTDVVGGVKDTRWSWWVSCVCWAGASMGKGRSSSSSMSTSRCPSKENPARNRKE